MSPKDLAATFVVGNIVSDLYGEQTEFSDENVPKAKTRMSSTLQPARSKDMDYKPSSSDAGTPPAEYKMDGAAGDVGTLIRSNGGKRERRTSSLATDDRNVANNLPTPDYGGGVGADDEEDSGYAMSGSLVRHGGSRGASKPGGAAAGNNGGASVQSALKYFREEASSVTAAAMNSNGAKGGPPSSTQNEDYGHPPPPAKLDSASTQQRGSGGNDDKLYADDIVMAAEVLELEGDRQLQKQNLLIKKVSVCVQILLRFLYVVIVDYAQSCYPNSDPPFSILCFLSIFLISGDYEIVISVEKTVSRRPGGAYQVLRSAAKGPQGFGCASHYRCACSSFVIIIVIRNTCSCTASSYAIF